MSTCHKCGRSPARDGITVFRINPIGELPAVWECTACLDVPIDADLLDFITDLKEVIDE